MATGTDHAGDLLPEEAMERLSRDKSAVLVDVRTVGEWETVGVPDLSGVAADPVFAEWTTAPAMTPNPTFVQEVQAALAARGAGPDAPLFFLCRSGARSGAAARMMAALGHAQSFNVAGGFEGSPGQGLPGWRRAGLPWKAG